MEELITHSTVHLTNIPQSYPGHEIQRKYDNNYNPEGPKAIWQLNVIWYPGRDSGTEQGC